MSTVTIEGVRVEQIDAAAAYLRSRGLTPASGPRGTVTGEATELAYVLDEATGVLTVDVLRLPRAIAELDRADQDAAVRGLVEDAVHRPGLLLGRPSTAGVYNYVLPTVVNDSGVVLTYSSGDLDHGTFTVTTQQFTPDQEAQAFDARSMGGSGLGVGGRIVYTVGIGSPTLTFDFFLNGVGEHSFNVGLSGGGASSYSITTTGTDPTLDCYTYLEPTVTVAAITA